MKVESRDPIKRLKEMRRERVAIKHLQGTGRGARRHRNAECPLEGQGELRDPRGSLR